MPPRYTRMVTGTHCMVEAHPDNAPEDLRLTTPFPELQVGLCARARACVCVPLPFFSAVEIVVWLSLDFVGSFARCAFCAGLFFVLWS